MTSSDTGTVSAKAGSSRSSTQLADRGSVYRVRSSLVGGCDLLKQLERRGYKINEYAKKILRSPAFRPTSAQHRVLLIKGELFADTARLAATIHVIAREDGLLPFTPEIASLLRLDFSDADIGRLNLEQIIALNEPCDGAPPEADGFLQATWQIGNGKFDASHCGVDDYWHKHTGFMFLMKD